MELTDVQGKELGLKEAVLTFTCMIGEDVTDQQLLDRANSDKYEKDYSGTTVIPNKAEVAFDFEDAPRSTNTVEVTPPPIPSEEPEKKVNGEDAIKLEQAEVSSDDSMRQDTLYTLFDQNLKVSLEDYTIKEDASSSGTDFTVSVNLKTYRDYGSKIVMFSTDHKTATVTKHRSYDPPSTRFNVTTLQGDTLGNISKIYYGTDKFWINILAENNPPLDGYTTMSTPLQGGITLSMPAYDASDGNPYN